MGGRKRKGRVRGRGKDGGSKRERVGRERGERGWEGRVGVSQRGRSHPPPPHLLVSLVGRERVGGREVAVRREGER